MSQQPEFEWVPSAIVGDHDLAAKENGPISLNIVRTAIRVTTAAGIPEMVSRWRQEDRAASGKKPGPQPWMPPAAIATLSLILTLVNRPPQVSEMRDLVLDRFTPEAWNLLNVSPPVGANRDSVYHRIRRSREILKALIDAEPGSLHKKMTPVEVTAMRAARDAADCEKRRGRGLAWANAMLHGTMQLLPDHVRTGYTGSLAIDATCVDAPASQGSNRAGTRISSEPDAGWYVREGDHDGSTSRAKTKYKRSHTATRWGREVTTAVTIGSTPDRAPEVPHIVIAMSLDVPGKRLPKNALTVVDAALKSCQRAGFLVTDRAYMPKSKPEDLQLPLRRRGYRLVMDYDSSEHMLGVQAGHEGAILVEGTWYCPSMPELLQTASFDYMMREEGDPLRITTEEYKRRIGQRDNYRLRRKERPDEDGYTRRMCPAAGPSATAVCPLQDQHPYARQKTGLTLIRSANLLDPPPRVCTNQSSLTFASTTGAKYEQEFAYKGDDWQAHFTYGRQTVESVNKSLKGGDSSIDRPTHRTARGWASQLMAIAPMIAATNVRKIIDWLETGPREPVKRKRRRDILDDIAA